MMRAVDCDPLLFHRDSFQIEPTEGSVWPNSFLDIAVLFTPQSAGAHAATAFCVIGGRETRLPLQLSVGDSLNVLKSLKGDAIGPKARFGFDLLDIEEVFIKTHHRYEVGAFICAL